MEKEKNGDLFGLFPKVVCRFNYEKDINKEIEFIKNIKYREGAYGGANTRSLDTHILRCKELEDINVFCKYRINTYLKDIILATNKLVITQSWINKSIKGKHHPEHHHPNSILSGVFYFEVNETAPITFFRMAPEHRIICLSYSKSNFFNSDRFILSIKSGQLVIFPSDLAHGVPENQKEEVRFSLSFNTFAIEMGDKETLTHLDIRDINDQNI